MDHHCTTPDILDISDASNVYRFTVLLQSLGFLKSTVIYHHYVLYHLLRCRMLFYLDIGRCGRLPSITLLVIVLTDIAHIPEFISRR